MKATQSLQILSALGVAGLMLLAGSSANAAGGCKLADKVGVGIAEAAVQATIGHMTHTRFEEAGNSLRDLPTLRAQLARMRIETDRARAHLCAVLDSLESPGPATQLMVLEAKAAGTEAAAAVTELAMRTCGGAAFGGAHGIERLFRDARAPIIMSPTSELAYEFIGRALCGLEVF